VPVVAWAVGSTVASAEGCSEAGAVVAGAVVSVAVVGAGVGLVDVVAGADVGVVPPPHATTKRPAAARRLPRRTRDMSLLVLGARGATRSPSAQISDEVSKF